MAVASRGCRRAAPTRTAEARSRKCALAGVIEGCQNPRVLTIGVVALGVTDVQPAAAFWRDVMGYEVRTDGFGGWATVLTPPAGSGATIALQRSQTPVQDHPRLQKPAPADLAQSPRSQRQHACNSLRKYMRGRRFSAAMMIRTSPLDKFSRPQPGVT